MENAKKKFSASADAAPQGRFSGKDGGQDISTRPTTASEKAEVLAAAASMSECRMIVSESLEDLMVRILGSSSAFTAAGGTERNMMALELVTVFDTLDSDEAAAAAELYSTIIERGVRGGDGWTAPAGMSPGIRDALVSIFDTAGKDEEMASLGGKAGMSERQIPLLVAEHARDIVRSRRYETERPRLEEGLWHLDDSIAAQGRAALKTVFGVESRFPECSDVLVCMTKKRVDELGVAGAIAEICEFMQGLREAGADGPMQEAAMSALAWFFDPDISPSFGGLRIISEIGSTGAQVVEPAASILAVVRSLCEPP